MKKFLLFLALAGLLSANSLQEIMEKKEIRIGVWKDQAPFGAYTNGQFEGFEIDMANKIGEKLFGKDGGKVVLVGLDHSDERMSFLQNNTTDVTLASYSVTKERAKFIDFCMPYFSVAQGLLTKRSLDIKPSELDTVKVAVQDGTVAHSYMKGKGADLLIVTSPADGYRAVVAGQADGYMNDNLIVMAYPIVDDTVHVSEQLRNLASVDYLAPAVAKDNTELKLKIDQIMIELSKEQYFKQIYRDTFDVFYRNAADPQMFLLEDFYRIYG